MALPMKNKLAIGVLVALILSGLTFGWFATSIKVRDIKPGSWGLSKIVEVQLDGGAGEPYFSTAAMRQGLAESVQSFYPPMDENGVGYVEEWALVRLNGRIMGEPDGDTIIFPDLDTTLSELSAGDRDRLLKEINSWLTGYTYKNYKDKEIIANFSLKNGDTAQVQDVVVGIFDYLGHSTARSRIAKFESHNTEYLDDFSTDPAARWTIEGQTFAWDSVNEEMDITYSGGTAMLRYSANDPGSIEHEAQVTFIATSGRGAGPAVRFFNDGTNITYGVDISSVDLGTGEATVSIIRSNTVLASLVVSGLNTSGSSHWWKARVAASGAVGENVQLDAWHFNGGLVSAGKPTDVGWFGDDGVPDLDYLDTAASRLDDGTLNRQTGIIGRSPSSDYDTRHDFFKQRAISDRGGAAVTPPLIEIKGGIKVRGGVNFR